MSDNKKKVIIIGGGITGLSTGLSMVRNVDIEDSPVLIIEKEPEVGGYVTTYRKRNYQFDTTQIIPDLKDVFEYLDINVNLKQINGSFARVYVTNTETGEIKPYKIPSNLERFETYLIESFPVDEKKIRAFFKYTKKIYDDLFHIKYNPTKLDELKILFKCRTTVKNSNKTFLEFYKKFRFKSKEIFDILNVFAAFSGVPSERVSALLIIGAMHSTLASASRPVEGFKSLPLEMKKQYLERGGQVMLNTSVQRIVVENGMSKGVFLEGGEFIESEYIVTTIDPKVAMGKLIGYDILRNLNKKFAQKIEDIEMSPSSIQIALGLDDNIDLQGMDFGGYNVLTTGGSSFEQLYEGYDLGKMCYSANLFHCSVIFPLYNNTPKNTIIIRVVPIPIGEWVKMHEENPWLYNKEKNDLADFFIGLVETYLIPSLSKHILVKDIATPATFARFSGSPTGSNYDVAPIPENFGKNRLPLVTPVKNILQPKFSHGIWPCMQGGLQASDYILEGGIMNGYSRFRKK